MFERIFVCAGHGKKGTNTDPGATTDNTLTPQPGDKATERTITVACARRVAQQLGPRAMAIGIDTDMTLEEKIAKVNQVCRDRKYTVTDTLLIEIHVDYEAAGSGFGGYFYTGSDTSKNFTQKILDKLTERTGRKTLWIRPDSSSNYGSLGIIRNTTPLATLIEVGGIKVDLGTLYGDKILDEADAIVEGIRAYAGWPTPVPVEPDPNVKKAMDLISSAWHDFESCKTIASAGQEKLNTANDILRAL